MKSFYCWRKSVFPVIGLLLLSLWKVQGEATLGPWVPIFQGVEHARGTNTPDNGGFYLLEVVNVLRIDLTDPDVKLFTTPRLADYEEDFHETGGQSVSNFLTLNKLQVAVNANDFHDPGTLDSPSYTASPGSPFDVQGLAICEGQIVSPQNAPIASQIADMAPRTAAILFTTNNQAEIVYTNWPAHSTDGIYTAITGTHCVLVNGVNIGDIYDGNGAALHQVQPRTAIGLSQDRRYLYFLTIDGRQGGYSDGAGDSQTAGWLLIVGAWDGINMDGGGSTTMVMASSTGHPIELNKPSAVPASGRERTVGSHIGVYAKPLTAFINDVIALPNDTTAKISWTTQAPATSQVQYGADTNFGSISELSSDLVTNHSVTLTGLTPATDYYYQVLSTTGSTNYASASFYFVTTNYVTTNVIFDLTNTWTYASANLDGTQWTAPQYDDSTWDGSGPGLLWADNRGPNADIPEPLNTRMAVNSNTTYPFITYYFRSHFTSTNIANALLFEAYVDDGAVFYLNGHEVYRLRMNAAPTVIANSTLASDYPCRASATPGNATCPDDFSISGNLLTNLLSGDNVIAVEVHNYNANSPDITFGLSLASTQPYTPYTTPPHLSIVVTNGAASISWDQSGFTLQQASSLSGTWADVPGPITSSPYTIPIAGNTSYFRLRK